MGCQDENSIEYRVRERENTENKESASLPVYRSSSQEKIQDYSVGLPVGQSRKMQKIRDARCEMRD